MTFDFKKEYKEFYMPGQVPQILQVPRMNYIAVRGQGDPNAPGGEYQRAMQVLYSVAFTIKMSHRTDHRIEGFYEYVVPPLESFWWQAGRTALDMADKGSFQWISAIRLPDFVTQADLAWAVETASKKKMMDLSCAEFLTVEEGLCVQIMHVGAFDAEADSIAKMDQYIAEQGYVTDLTETRRHHEIYLSDARRVAPGKWKTVIRHPIRRAE